MGAWGAGLYADDTTCDVRDAYTQALRTGLSDQAACAGILEKHRATLRHPEVACLVYFALADTAWRYGRLSETLRSKALALLQAGGDLAVWQQEAPGDLAARRRVLRTLQVRLQSPQPPRKPVKVSAPKAPLVRATAPVGSLFLLALPSGASAALVLVAYRDLGESIDPVFSALRWRGARADLPVAPAGHDTLPFASFARQHAHVAILPGDRQKDIMESLQPTGNIAEGFAYVPDSTVWLSIRRIAAQIEIALGVGPGGGR